MRDQFSNIQAIRKPAVTSRGGIVAAQSRKAAEVGAEVLAAGGDCVDAVIATTFALGVVEPWMSGLGGGGAMVLYRAREDRYEVIDYGMRAPLSLNPADYPLVGNGAASDIFPWPRVKDDRNIHGPGSIAVPGVVAGMEEAHRRHAKLPWKELLAPSVTLAGEGLEVDWWTTLMISSAAADLRRYPASAAAYLLDGLPPNPQWGIKSRVRMGSLRALAERSSAGGADDPVLKEARVAATELLPEAVGYIRSSTEKMERLISTILKLAREGRRPLKIEPVDLREVVAGGAAAIQHQLSEASGKIEFQLDVPVIQSDRFSLDLIIGNLLDNAVKYRAKERPLHINVRTRPVADDRVEIEIVDNGRGIAERDQARVFDLFKRSGTQDQPGEGIGLAYVLAALRNLGGDIGLTSEIGRGTSFRLTMGMADVVDPGQMGRERTAVRHHASLRYPARGQSARRSVVGESAACGSPRDFRKNR